MNSLIGTLAFVSIFHIIGGVALGATVRGWLHGRFACNSLFFLVWGGMFGVVPSSIGYSTFVQHGAIQFFGIELGVLIGTILLVALVPDWFRESFDARTLAPIAFGGIFLLTGVGVGAATFGSSPAMALVIGGLFAGVGGLVFVWGLVQALKA